MIPIVRTFGAPVIEPLGKSARKTSARPVSGSSSAVTVDVSCHTVSNRSGSNTLAHRTVPGAGDAAEVVAQQVDDHRVLGAVLHRGREALARSASSSASQRPRGAVPFIGRVVSRSPSSRKNSSGDAETRCGSGPAFRYARVRAPLRVAEVAVETALVALDGRAQPERVVHLVRVAGGDVLADASRSPGRSGRGRRSAPTRRTAGTLVARRRQARSPAAAGTSRTRRAAAGRTGRPAARARTTSDGSSPGAASYATNPATHRPRAAAPSAAASVGTTSSGRIASRTPAGSVRRNDGDSPVRSSNRASITMPARSGALAGPDLVDQGGQELQRVGHDAQVGQPEDRRVGDPC